LEGKESGRLAIWAEIITVDNGNLICDQCQHSNFFRAQESGWMPEETQGSQRSGRCDSKKYNWGAQNKLWQEEKQGGI